jgi:hypothetical protein
MISMRAEPPARDQAYGKRVQHRPDRNPAERDPQRTEVEPKSHNVDDPSRRDAAYHSRQRQPCDRQLGHGVGTGIKDVDGEQQERCDRQSRAL